MTSEELRAAGEKIFGYGWQSKLARALNINARTVRRWAGGYQEVPPWVEVALQGVLAARKEAG